MHNFINTHRIIPAISVLLVLAGCTQSLSMKTISEVPAPLVTQLPLNMGVFYEDEFRNYIYTEDSEDRPDWSIDTGESQVQLFDQILPSMFTGLEYVDGTSQSGSGLDGILAPHVDEIQFALPDETRSELYEVWIKYRISLHEPDGDTISEWTVSGYGKSPTEFFKSRSDGIQNAINSAFRDAGAKLALNFTRIPEIKLWLAGKPEVCRSTTNIC